MADDKPMQLVIKQSNLPVVHKILAKTWIIWPRQVHGRIRAIVIVRRPRSEDHPEDKVGSRYYAHVRYFRFPIGSPDAWKLSGRYGPLAKDEASAMKLLSDALSWPAEVMAKTRRRKEGRREERAERAAEVGREGDPSSQVNDGEETDDEVINARPLMDEVTQVALEELEERLPGISLYARARNVDDDVQMIDVPAATPGAGAAGDRPIEDTDQGVTEWIAGRGPVLRNIQRYNVQRNHLQDEEAEVITDSEAEEPKTARVRKTTTGRKSADADQPAHEPAPVLMTEGLASMTRRLGIKQIDDPDQEPTTVSDSEDEADRQARNRDNAARNRAKAKPGAKSKTRQPDVPPKNGELFRVLTGHGEVAEVYYRNGKCWKNPALVVEQKIEKQLQKKPVTRRQSQRNKDTAKQPRERPITRRQSQWKKAVAKQPQDKSQDKPQEIPQQEPQQQLWEKPLTKRQTYLLDKDAIRGG